VGNRYVNPAKYNITPMQIAAATFKEVKKEKRKKEKNAKAKKDKENII
jgi:hypothetical protein